MTLKVKGSIFFWLLEHAPTAQSLENNARNKKKYIYTQDGMKERGGREEGAPLYSRKRGWVSMRGGGL